MFASFPNVLLLIHIWQCYIEEEVRYQLCVPTLLSRLDRAGSEFVLILLSGNMCGFIVKRCLGLFEMCGVLKMSGVPGDLVVLLKHALRLLKSTAPHVYGWA